MKLIHITDTHLVEAGQTLYGLDPRARLDAAIADINRNHRDAALCVVTGDLTHFGDQAAYDSFRSAFASLAVPYVALVGNHDRRAACLGALEAAPRDSNDFVQGLQDIGDTRLIFLDTLDETSHAGQLCERRTRWLRMALAATPAERQILIFMHHPPFEVGIHDMDRIALAERAQFLEVLRPYLPRVRHLFFGHVHRPICGSWQGIPFSTLRGTNHQVWFDMASDAEHLASHEPPAYAVVLVHDGRIVVHTHDYLDASPRFPFADPALDERTYALGRIGFGT